MPLRDHFRPPLDDRRHWEGFHAAWPVMMVALLKSKLPRRYFAEPWIQSGSGADIVVASFEGEGAAPAADDENGDIATAEWAPPRPTRTVVTDLPAQDVYEVRVYDEKRQCRLVAAVEIVSPSNKDRPEHRRAFVAKCAALLQQPVSVVIVDMVTTRTPNLYGELLDLIGLADPSLNPAPPPLYVTACRLTKRADEWLLESWALPLELGRPAADGAALARR